MTHSKAVSKIREAGNALLAYLHEASDMAVIGPKPPDEWHVGKNRAIAAWEEALSALSLLEDEGKEQVSEAVQKLIDHALTAGRIAGGVAEWLERLHQLAHEAHAKTWLSHPVDQHPSQGIGEQR